MVHLTIGKNQGPNSKDEKVISLLSPFRNRRDMVAYRGHAFRAIFETDRHCVAYRGAVNNQGSPRVYWILGRLKIWKCILE